MSRYPDHLTRMRIHLDLDGRERTVTVDVPAAWAAWDDDRREWWARRACEAALYERVTVSWSDDAWEGPDDAWPDSWDMRTGDLIA